MTRRTDLAELLPQIISASFEPIPLSDIYSEVERRRPDLVDDELEAGSTTVLRWKHELRWELETLVVAGGVRRRKDVGRAIYST